MNRTNMKTFIQTQIMIAKLRDKIEQNPNRMSVFALNALLPKKYRVSFD